MAMDNEVFEQAEMAFLAAREQVSDDELIARMNSAPDLGGASLVELRIYP